jgi:hypothetical protein
MKRLTFEKIKEVPKDSSVALAALLSSIPFFFLTLFFIINEHVLRASSGYGVLDFELVWNRGMAHRILRAWGTSNVRYEIFAHHIDNLYLVVYALFAALCILLIARRLKGRLQEIGFFFVLAPVLAAIFDAMENVFLLSMMRRGIPVGRASPALASLCATFKIAFLGATLSFIFIAGILLLVKRFRVPLTYYYLALLAAGIATTWLLVMWRPYLGYVIGPVYFAIAFLFGWTIKIEASQEAQASA